MDVDKRDMKILRMLMENGRTSYSNLAKETGLSDVAIKKRVDRLVSKGVIKRFTVDIDARKLGLGLHYMLFIRAEAQSVPLLYKKMSNLMGSEEVMIVSGEYSLIVRGYTRDVESLKGILKDIGKMDGVIEVKPEIVLEYERHPIRVPEHIGQRVLV